MKTLKKALAVVLALAMVLGMAVTASATFADAATITDKEACEVMNALGVFIGTNGKMNPKANLTRAEAAKLIAYLLVGEDVAEALPVVSVFKDVNTSNWANKYIAYLASEKIVGGVGEGKFNPQGNVTGYEFGKMLLVALGYDAEIEGMTGSNWSINVAKLMASNDIADKVTASPVAALTREEAARYCLNALQATMVEYKENSTITAGNVTIKTAGAATAVTGYNTYFGDNKQLVEKLYSKLAITTTTDSFGAPSTQWTLDGTEVGVYPVTAKATYTDKVTKGTIYSLFGKTTVGKMTPVVTLNGNATPYEVIVYVDGKNVTLASISDIADNGNSGSISANGAKLTGNGTITNVYVDDNDDITISIVNTYVVQATADYNVKSEKITFAPVGPEKFTTSSLAKADFPQIVNYEEDDYLLVTAKNNGTAYVIETVEKADVVEGKASGFKAGSTPAVTLDGTTYKFAKKAVYAGAAYDADVSEIATDTTVSIVLDKNGYVIAVDDIAVASSNYVYVSKIASETVLSTKYVANAYFADGRNEVITVKSINGSNPTDDPGWYTYTVNDKGAYLLSTKIIGNTNMTIGQYAAKKNVAKVQAEALTANSKTVFVVADSDDIVKVYTGVGNVPTIKAGTNGAVMSCVTKNGFVTLAFIQMKADTSVEDESATDLIYVLDQGTTKNLDGDGQTFYNATVLVNGEKETIKTAGSSTLTAGRAYSSLTKNAYGYVSSASEATSNITKDDLEVANDPFVYSGGVLNVKYDTETDDNYLVADNCKVVFLNEDSDLMNDKGASYEYQTDLSVQGLFNILKGYKPATDGVYVIAKTDANTGKLVELYVYVTDVAVDSDIEFTAARGTEATLTVTPNATLNTGAKTITVTVSGGDKNITTGKTIVISGTPKSAYASAYGEIVITGTATVTTPDVSGTITLLLADGTVVTYKALTVTHTGGGSTYVVNYQ